MKIFVAIPSYRDPELSDTVASVIAKADRPKNLSFGICQQDDPDNFITLRQHRWSVRKINFKNYPAEQSLGLGWALNQCFSMYSGEEFFLQIDSHTEMDESWDTKIINDYRQAQQSAHQPCIFSVYPDIYSLDQNLQRILDHNGYLSRTRLIWGPGNLIPDGNALRLESQRPAKSRYLNGGFMFGDGSFAVNVPYNPDVYFFGIEIYTTVRCYTHGFDLFHPTQRMCWHHYGDRRNHSDVPPHHGNIVDESKRSVKFSQRAIDAEKIIIDLLLDRYSGSFGTGNERTVKDFEKYAGIDFANCRYITEEAETGLYKD